MDIVRLAELAREFEKYEVLGYSWTGCALVERISERDTIPREVGKIELGVGKNLSFRVLVERSDLDEEPIVNEDFEIFFDFSPGDAEELGGLILLKNRTDTEGDCLHEFIEDVMLLFEQLLFNNCPFFE